MSKDMRGKSKFKITERFKRRFDVLVRFVLRWLFKLTPAKWICEGCYHQGKYGLRNKWGCWITETYGSYDDGYEGEGLCPQCGRPTWGNVNFNRDGSGYMYCYRPECGYAPDYKAETKRSPSEVKRRSGETRVEVKDNQ